MISLILIEFNSFLSQLSTLFDNNVNTKSELETIKKIVNSFFPLIFKLAKCRCPLLQTRGRGVTKIVKICRCHNGPSINYVISVGRGRGYSFKDNLLHRLYLMKKTIGVKNYRFLRRHSLWTTLKLMVPMIFLTVLIYILRKQLHYRTVSI